MDECLVCKVCIIVCFIKVDVFIFCLCFLNFYYSYYVCFVKDYFVVGIE